MAETWSLPTPSMEQLREDDATSVLLAEHNSLRTTAQRWRNTPAGKLSYKYEGKVLALKHKRRGLVGGTSL